MADRSQHDETIVEQHTQQAKGYAQLTQNMSGDRPRRAEVIGVRPDDFLLDIACGPGSLTLELAPHVLTATGLDITPAMLEQARIAQAQKDIDNVDWVEGDAARLPFPDASFSLVTCSAAFHHFEHPAAILSEMARVCQTDGRIVVTDVTPEPDKADAYDRMEKMRDPSHGHAHPVTELAAMGEKQGLGMLRMQTGLTGPMPYLAVLATSFPKEYSRDDLLTLMREDAESGEDKLGFKAQIGDADQVLVSYPISTVVWSKP